MLRPYEQQITKDVLSMRIKTIVGGTKTVASEMKRSEQAIYKALSACKSTRLGTLVKLAQKIGEIRGEKTDDLGELLGLTRLKGVKVSDLAITQD